MGFGVGVFFGWMGGVAMCAGCLLWVDGMLPELCAYLWRRMRGE